MSVIEITNRDDLRVGDTATFAFEGHEFTGPLWERESGTLFIGLQGVRYEHQATGELRWPEYFGFVRATREMPPLPTEMGDVILVSECRGERVDVPVLAVCDGDGEWRTYGHEFDGHVWHLPKHITAWAPAKVFPA